MLSKSFFTGIAAVQEALLYISFTLIIALPVMLAYAPDALPEGSIAFLYEVSLTAAFLVLLIRPLADLFPGVPWLRPLVILRKGFGVLSATIIVSFAFAKIMLFGSEYLLAFFSSEHWSFENYAILAPLGDISAFILLVTSNKFSKRVLGVGWKRVQKLAYLYFYAGALYEYLVLGQEFAFWFALVVFSVSVAAFIKKRAVPLPLPA